MSGEAKLADWRRTAAHQEAAGPDAASSRGWIPEFRRGCSLFASSVGVMPRVERLLGRMRVFAMPSPRVETVVGDEARQMGESKISCRDRGAISGGPRQQFSGRFHRRFLHEWDLVPFHKFPAPGVDLLVDVDLDRADIGAAAIEARSEWQVVVFVSIEGRIDDQTNWA